MIGKVCLGGMEDDFTCQVENRFCSAFWTRNRVRRLAPVNQVFRALMGHRNNKWKATSKGYVGFHTFSIESPTLMITSKSMTQHLSFMYQRDRKSCHIPTTPVVIGHPVYFSQVTLPANGKQSG